MNYVVALFFICCACLSHTANALFVGNLTKQEVGTYLYRPIATREGQTITRLHQLAQNNDFTSLQKFTQHFRLDLDPQDSVHYQTPLFLAVNLGHLQTTHILLQEGANIAHRDAYGLRAYDYLRLLHNETTMPHHKEMCKLLEKYGAHYLPPLGIPSDYRSYPLVINSAALNNENDRHTLQALVINYLSGPLTFERSLMLRRFAVQNNFLGPSH